MPRKHDRTYDAPDNEPPKTKRPRLSNGQLERKRELDREAQRSIRERTKSHIAHLECLVESLQGDRNGQVAQLVAQLNESRAQINRLKDALNSIVKITSTVTDEQLLQESYSPVLAAPISKQNVTRKEPEPEPTAKKAVLQQDSDDTHAADEQPEAVATSKPPVTKFPEATSPRDATDNDFSKNLVDLGTYSSFETPLTWSVAAKGKVTDESVPASLALTAGDKRLSINQVAASIVNNKALDGRYWYLAGVLLSYILRTQHEDTFISCVHDEDIAIRAVLEGWSAVMERYPLDRGWQWLKELDERIYYKHLGPAERLMHLRNCRFQFLHQLFPNDGWNQNLPAFFAARPSQQYLEHDPLIEHFPWPSFRERLLFSPRKYATDVFMDALRRNVHFVWNYEPRDLCQKDSSTGLYMYSDLFSKHMMDIKCYTVKPAFFEKFPELKSDIPWNNDPSPLSLIAHSVSTVSSSTDSIKRRSHAHTDDSEDYMAHELDTPGCSDTNALYISWIEQLNPNFIEELEAI